MYFLFYFLLVYIGSHFLENYYSFPTSWLPLLVQSVMIEFIVELEH